jgi:hypothetical protein
VKPKWPLSGKVDYSMVAKVAQIFPINRSIFSDVDFAAVQAVSRWPLTTEARVRARVNPCGICGGQSGTGQVFSEYFGFPCKYIIPPLLHIHLSQPRSSVRGFTSDPAHWLEQKKKVKKKSYLIPTTANGYAKCIYSVMNMRSSEFVLRIYDDY